MKYDSSEVELPSLVVFLKMHFIHMSVLPTCVFVQHRYAWCTLTSEEGAGCSGARVTGDGGLLGTGLGFFARAVSVFNHQAIPLALVWLVFVATPHLLS